MQLNRGQIIGPADHRDHLAIAQPGAALDELAHQPGADAQAGGVGGDIDRRFQGVAIGRAGAELGGIGVALHDAIPLGDQIRRAVVEHGLTASRDLGRIGGDLFVRRRAVLHMMGIDALDVGHVGGLRIANNKGVRHLGKGSLYRFKTSTSMAQMASIMVERLPASLAKP